MRRAKLGPSEIDQAAGALVGSSSFHDAIATLPPDLGRTVTDAAATGFAAGIADALVVTGGIVLATLITVRLLWPGRHS